MLNMTEGGKMGWAKGQEEREISSLKDGQLGEEVGGVSGRQYMCQPE